jgi:hypothetical protein
MFGMRGLNSDSNPEPNTGLQVTSSEPNRSSNQRPQHAQTYIDQLPLNWSSQSSQYAPTLTSADSASMRNEPELLYQHGQRSTEHNHDNRENDDRKSMISTHSYRSDIDAYRFLREVEGRVSIIPAHETLYKCALSPGDLLYIYTKTDRNN